MRIDGRLAMLGCDDNQRRVEQVLICQLRHHLPDTGVDELDFIQHGWSWGRLVVRIPADRGDASLDQLLPDAYSLKVHSEEAGDKSSGRFARLDGCAELCLTINPMEDRIHLQCVVALDVLETV